MAKSGKGGWRAYSEGRKSRSADWRKMTPDGGPVSVNTETAKKPTGLQKHLSKIASKARSKA